MARKCRILARKRSALARKPLILHSAKAKQKERRVADSHARNKAGLNNLRGNLEMINLANDPLVNEKNNDLGWTANGFLEIVGILAPDWPCISLATRLCM